MTPTPRNEIGGHTPVPWKVVPEKLYRGQHVAGRSPAVVADDLMVARLNHHEPLGEANAAFIVRACNSHDELVAALKRLLENHGAYIDQLPGPSGVSDLAKARAALKAAEAV